jgi:hypothetical protein
MTLDNSGQLGIGTSSPGAKLHVASGAILIDNAQKIQGKDSSGTIRDIITPWTDNIVYIDGYASGIQIRTNYQATNAIKIDGSGNVGIGTTSPTATLDVVGTFSHAKANIVSQTLTDAATISWDTSLGQIATVTLGASRTMGAPTNLRVGTYILHVIQGGTGSYTITWNGVFKWTAGVAPTLSTVVGRRDVFSFISDGTNLYGAMIPDVR